MPGGWCGIQGCAVETAQGTATAWVECNWGVEQEAGSREQGAGSSRLVVSGEAETRAGFGVRMEQSSRGRSAIRMVQWITVGWMLIELCIALYAGVRAHSVA